eukprot:466454-Pelagomonas_calceolata.AAC.7
MACNNKEGNIGFLKMRNRINVMLSRAQWGLYILGNRATLEANADRAPMWSEDSAVLHHQQHLLSSDSLDIVKSYLHIKR